MPLADPEARAEYNRERWRTHGHIYRAQRTGKLPPISRQQVLVEDIAQSQELAKLEGRRIGYKKATSRLKAFIRSERKWISATSTPYVLGGLDAGD